MRRFQKKYHKDLVGAINGWDRIALRGTIRWLANLAGFEIYMVMNGILLKDFGGWAQAQTEKVRAACERTAESLGIVRQYLRSSSMNKEAMARAIAKDQGIEQGPICMFSVVEPSFSPTVVGNRKTQRLELVMRQRKCVWVYFYWIDPDFGFGHLRLQTWVPFTIQGCLNGREWLARQMSREHIKYIKSDNCFRWIADCGRAQQLLNEQLCIHWPSKLNAIKNKYFSIMNRLFSRDSLQYYWSVDESEWATDLMFKSTAALDRLFPLLARHSLLIADSANVLRFLGKIEHSAILPARVSGEIKGDRRRRYEGIRTRHWADCNSVKAYNKAGNVLRVETTINNPRAFKVFRRANDDPDKKPSWQNMRKGVADMHRRARVSQRSNERYLDALAACQTDATVLETLEHICKPTKKNGRSIRALNPWSPRDFHLLQFLAQGQWNVRGLKNRDLVGWLHDPINTLNPADRRKASARASRLLRILVTHGLIRKVHKTYRYMLTQKGKQIAAIVLTASSLRGQQLMEIAA